MTSNYISVTLLRWRQLLRDLVMEEVQDTVKDASQTQDEFQNPIASLRGS